MEMGNNKKPVVHWAKEAIEKPVDIEWVVKGIVSEGSMTILLVKVVLKKHGLVWTWRYRLPVVKSIG